MTGPDPADKKTTKAARGSAVPDATPIEPAAVDATVAATPAAAPKPKAPKATPAPVAPAAVTPATAEPATVAPAPVPPPATAPTAAAPAPAAPGAAAPTDAAQPAAAAASGGTKFSTPDVAAAVDKAYDRLRTHLTVGEIVAGLGAAVILVIAWATFGVLFYHGGTWPADLVMLLSVGLLVVLVIQNAHIHDFGPNYRLVVAGACFALGILATLSFLRELRGVFSGDPFDIGGLTWWAGAWIAVLGGVMVWREGR